VKKHILSVIILCLLVSILIINIWQDKPSNNLTTSSETVTADISEHSETGLKKNELAPDFTLESLDGQEVKLSDYQGQKVILNFWASWCPPCKAEMPHMQTFYEKNKDNGVTILAVNLTSQDHGMEQIGSFVQDYNLTFPIPLDQTGEIGDLYRTITIPTTYFIDEKGHIQDKVIGPMDEEKMTSIINQM